MTRANHDSVAAVREVARKRTVASDARALRIALMGNPNTGKTTFFNRLCGLRAKTANFPGITAEARVGYCAADRQLPVAMEIVDLPGIYRLTLDVPESRLCRDIVQGTALYRRPDAVLIVVDATNLPRNLLLVGELLAQGLPTVVALNMADLAQRQGLTIDAGQLAREIGCPVIPTMARKGHGVAEAKAALVREIDRLAARAKAEGQGTAREGLAAIASDYALLEAWADRAVASSVGGEAAVGEASDTFTERLDKAFTHPVLGLLIFAGVMAGLFAVIFQMATIPMDLIQSLFDALGRWVSATLPAGSINDLLSQGVIGGVGATVVFLPQICLLFFLISLLEDTGYLARAAFVMDRIMCRFGLPGQAFVPLLSSHACALPGIMSAKLIPDRHDRLATILVAPFMSCSARVPVYVLLTTLLFRDRPWLAGLAFFGCYLLGAGAGLMSAFIARRTILRGRSRPMVLELPSYKLPALRSALWTTLDRGLVFLRTAGTIILAISVVLWWLRTYPHTEAPQEAVQMRQRADEIRSGDPDAGDALLAQARHLEASHATRESYAGKIGRAIQPVFAPLGYDWQLTVGVLTSFAAREVFVATMSILLTGDEDVDVGDDSGFIERIRGATRDDQTTPVFTAATSASVLVFFVLAMQCLSTLVVTRRETGSWKWAGLQLGYMSGLAWIAAFITYQGLTLVGVS